MELQFCRRCGAPLSLKHHHFICANGHEIFPAPIPSTGIFLINDSGEVLLSVRGRDPNRGMLDAFGGFVDGDETLEESLERELKEELGLTKKDHSKPEFLTSAIGKYSYGGETITVLSSLFWARVSPDAVLMPQDDVAEVYIAKPRDVELDQLHDDDVRNGFKKLLEVLESQDVL